MNNRYTDTKKRGIQTHYIEAQKEVKKSEDEKQDQLIRQLLDNQQQISERLALPYNPPVKEEDPTLLPNYLFDETQSLPSAKGHHQAHSLVVLIKCLHLNKNKCSKNIN